jgi:DNA-binding TFAR19-related protein (PDSD5 family)
MDRESEKQLVKSAVEIIDEIKLTPNDIEKYEECEIISDLLDEEILRSIDDEELRTILVRISPNLSR